MHAGSPSQAGLIKDAEAAFDYLSLRRDVCDPDTIFLFGRSLGGAVAMELASRREGRVRGIIVEVRQRFNAPRARCRGMIVNHWSR